MNIYIYTILRPIIAVSKRLLDMLKTKINVKMKRRK